MIVQEEKSEFGLAKSSKDPCGFKRKFEVLGLLKIRSDLGFKTFESDIKRTLGLHKSQTYTYLKNLENTGRISRRFEDGRELLLMTEKGRSEIIKRVLPLFPKQASILRSIILEDLTVDDLTLSYYFDKFIRFILPDAELFLRKRLFQVMGKEYVPEAYLKKLRIDLATFFSNKLELYSKINNLQKKAVK